MRYYKLDFVYKGKTDRGKRRLLKYLLEGRLFLMQCSKIPITRSISTTEPAASDTVNTSRPVSETNKQPKMILVEEENNTESTIPRETKLYECHYLMSSGGIPLNHRQDVSTNRARLFYGFMRNLLKC